jgi:hypothetical protein
MTPMSPLTPVSQNHEGNMQENTGDILGTGGIISPVSQKPPVETDENHAQNTEIGDTGHTGGIIPIPPEESRGEEKRQQKSSIQSATTNTVYTILQEQHQPSNPFHNLLYSCYYCDNFETNTKQDYQQHVLLKHPGKLCYPSKADLTKFGLEPKGKESEV